MAIKSVGCTVASSHNKTIKKVTDLTEAKKRIGEVASKMIDGSMNYLEGSLKLLSLREEVGAYENDPDFVAFVAVASEIHRLPIRQSHECWSVEDLECDEAEINESIEWAKEFSLDNCKSLVKRYNG